LKRGQLEGAEIDGLVSIQRIRIQQQTPFSRANGYTLQGIGPSGTRMRRSRPLTATHPELLIIETPGLCREYRIENWHPSRSQHGRFSGLPWVSRLDVFSVVLLGLLWPSVRFFPNLPSPSLGGCDS
jgi:hypothetical protein